MSRPVYVTAFVLFALGSSIFFYKHISLDMPIQPDRSARVWRVEVEITFLGGGRQARIELQVPRSEALQVLLDAQSFDDGLAFTRVELDDRHLATWSGRVEGVRRVAYTFRVHLPRPSERIRHSSLDVETRSDSPRMDGEAAPEFRKTLADLGAEAGDTSAAIVATAFGFVTNSIEAAAGGSDDARLVLSAREGSPTGRARLLRELLRAGGVQARMARGLALPRVGATTITPFVEARLDAGWIPLFPETDSPGDRPSHFVVLGHDDRPILATSGVGAAQLDVTVLREMLPPTELASFVAPKSAFWRALSLYRLPIETQSTLQVLMVIPLATLIASIFRNLVGIRTFGTFMPILIALSLRRTDLATGLVVVASVTLAGLVGRLLLDRLRLLFVPRICLLLCLVVLFVTGLAQIGYEFESSVFMSGLLFPIVILSMLIERVSVTMLEEGLDPTARLVAGSLTLTALTYPVFQSDWLAHVFFGFPELIFCVMALLVLVGGYTGYRLSELWRFRSFGRTTETTS